MPGDEPLYCADPQAFARTAELEDLTLLFHRPSGATHVLAPPAPQILEMLETKASLVELRARMAERFELQGDEHALAGRVEELVTAGLVRRL